MRTRRMGGAAVLALAPALHATTSLAGPPVKITTCSLSDVQNALMDPTVTKIQIKTVSYISVDGVIFSEFPSVP